VILPGMRLLGLGILLTMALAAPAQASLQGKYLQSCPVNVSVQQDPLAAPGVEVSDHPHDSAGSSAFGKDMTTGAMLAAPTSCFLRSNHSAYWWPAMQRADGTLAHARSITTYYAAAGADPAAIAGGKVQPFPTGLRFLFGNPSSTVLQSTSLIRWHCNHANPDQYDHPPTSCPGTEGITVDFNTFPCWDGMHLDTADHKSHMAPAVVTPGGSGCPADHPVRVPQLQISFAFAADAVGACPSSDHGIGPCGRSAHMDLWEAQDPAVQDQLTRCLNDPARNSPTSPLCGLFTFTTNNGWLPRAEQWANVIGYVASTGDPTYGFPIPVTP
jgi:hypothetical protein